MQTCLKNNLVKVELPGMVKTKQKVGKGNKNKTLQMVTRGLNEFIQEYHKQIKK